MYSVTIDVKNMEKQVVFITGGASGLGRVIVYELLQGGRFVVYGTSRNDEPSIEKGIHFVKMDLTSDDSVEHAVDEVLAQAGRIDVVINNAGATLAGASLHFSVDDFRRLFEINVLGAFRILKHLNNLSRLPRLVVNITSLNGFFSFPNFGLYSATKFAAEALGTALRYELPLTTQIVNVAPGALESDSVKNMPHRSARQKLWIIRMLMPLTTQATVAKKVAALLRMKRVPLHVRIGQDARIIHALQRIFPEWVLEKIINFVWNKH